MSTVKSLLRRYAKLGEAGLHNDFKNCGPQSISHEPLMYRATLWLRRLHPQWGAGRIRARLATRYAASRLPCERTMERWLKAEKLTEPRQSHNEPRIGAAKAVHNIWQVDAKEQLILSDGSVACYLTVTDERSGSWLGAPAFPYHRICQVPLEDVRNALIRVFQRWGQPGALRVDNGKPLGNARNASTPVLALWLIAMDVDMIWNKPACPQQNGKVERMQGTSSRWAEPENCVSLERLQKRLDEESAVQREQLRVRRLKMKTRLETYPEIETSRRIYRPESFNVRRVHDFLAKKIYVRKTSSNAALNLFGQVFRVGTQNKNKNIQIKLNPDTCEWHFFDFDKEIAVIKAEHLSEKNILNLNNVSKN